MRAKVRTEFLISCHQGAFLVKKLRTGFLISCHQGAFLVKKRPYYSSDTKNRQNRKMQKSHQKLFSSKWKYFFLKKVILKFWSAKCFLRPSQTRSIGAKSPPIIGLPLLRLCQQTEVYFVYSAINDTDIYPTPSIASSLPRPNISICIRDPTRYYSILLPCRYIGYAKESTLIWAVYK